MRLKCNLRRLLAEKDITIREFADSIGVARATLYGILDNDWKKISKDTLENICSHLSLHDISELFTLEEEKLWWNLNANKKLNLMLGMRREIRDYSRDSDGKQGIAHTSLGYWDTITALELTEGLTERFNDINVRRYFFSNPFQPEEAAQVLTLLKSGTCCVMLGSPIVNASLDLAIQLHNKYMAEIGNGTGQSHNSPPCPPYLFQWPAAFQDCARTTVMSRTVPDGDPLGIYSVESEGLVAEVTPRWGARMHARQNKECYDSALVVACDDFLGAKTTVLAVSGCGGVGTLGAVRAILRDCSPIDKFLQGKPDQLIFGIVNTVYHKPTDTDRDDRILKEWDFAGVESV